MNWWDRLRKGKQLETELDAELRFHFDAHVDAHMRNGVPEAEAVRRTRMEFGGLDQVKEDCRDARGTRWLEEIAQDLRYAARLLLKDRSFTMAAVVALALGIGMNGTMFTIVNAMIRGLPMDHPDRIMSIHARDSAGRWRGLGVSYLDFQDFRAATKAFAGLAAFSQTTTTLSDDGRAADRVSTAYLSANAIQLLGQQPVIGRDFLPEDDEIGAARVVILGSRIWNTRYHADPMLIGRTVQVNGVASTVIGVMPDGFRFPVISDMWQPLALLPGLTEQRRDVRSLQVIGKLADGSNQAQAQAEIASISARLSRNYPDTNGNIGVMVTRFPGDFAPKPILIALMGGVALVLLVACANVANLLLVRSANRSREISIRGSLGASRWRIVRQLIVESSLVAATAGALGFGFSLAGMWVFARAVADITFPYYIQWTMDGRVLWFVTALCLGIGFLVGLLPALHVSNSSSTL